jgi:hypothetical protein
LRITILNPGNAVPTDVVDSNFFAPTFTVAATEGYSLFRTDGNSLVSTCAGKSLVGGFQIFGYYGARFYR